MLLDVGSRVADRYRLEARLGAGAMGVVWRARDERLDRVVAVKLLAASILGSATARSRLLREAKAAAALTHPHAIAVYDVGETDDGTTYLVMELVDGATLSDRLANTATTMADKLRWISEAASALGAAHKVGLVHRDVKPDNLLVRTDGRLVVLDFGLAKRTDEGESSATQLTHEGAILGTPAYMSPEQAEGKSAGAASDQWSLAILAYRAITGASPWIGKSIPTLLAEICNHAPPPPSTRVAGLTADVDAVFERAFAKDPSARFATIEAFAQALAAAMRGVTVTPRRAADGGNTPTITDDEALPSPTAASAPASPASASTSIAARPVTTSDGAEADRAQAQGTTVRTARARPWRVVGLAAVAALAIVPAMRAWTRARATKSVVAAAPIASPLAAPDAKIGCVPLLARGVDRSITGWYGAAAASAICRDVMYLRGATTNAIVVPAQLLALPTAVTNDFPEDPYGAADARARALTAAKRASDAYLDGEVEVVKEGVRVRVALRSSVDDRELGRAEVTSRRLSLAAREAVFSWVDRGAMPMLPVRPGALVAGSDDAKLASLVSEGFDDPELDFADLCGRVRAIDPTIAHASPIERGYCDPRSLLKAFVIDRASPGRLIESLVADSELGANAPASVFTEEVAPKLATTTNADDRAVLQVVLALAKHHAGDFEGGCQLVRAAIAEAPAYWLPWDYLPTLCEATRATLNATVGWFPNVSPGMAMGIGRDETPASRLARLRELLAQAPLSPSLQISAARELALQSHVEDAQELALAVATNAQASPFAKAIAPTFAQIARGRAKAACDTLRAQILSRPLLDGSASATALASLLACAELLGTETETADALLLHFDIPAAAASKSVTARWHREKLSIIALRASPELALRVLDHTRDASLTAYGYDTRRRALVEARARHDHPAALAAARELVVTAYAGAREAAVLDEIGADDLGGPLDERLAALGPTEIGGTPLALPRMARRAMRQGHIDEAKKIAQRVIDAWSLVDEPVPAVAEMRAIVAGTWRWKPAW